MNKSTYPHHDLSSSVLQAELDALVVLALAEDLGSVGDVSSSSVFTSQTASFVIKAREQSVVYGVWVLERIVLAAGQGIRFEPRVSDGQIVARGAVLGIFTGSVRRILELERTFLNFLGFLSGIATRTRAFVELAQSLGNTKIVDTRKTLPGWRRLSKAAVLAGGGQNHRMGLYDMVMLKDNHIDAAGSLSAAVELVRKGPWRDLPLEVECRTLDDVRVSLDLGVDIAMLDNMSPELCSKAVELRTLSYPDSRTAFEASGDMSLERLPLFAGLGLEYISVGALTHSVRNANFSMVMGD